MNDYNREIHEILKELGISPALSGYAYVKDALVMWERMCKPRIRMMPLYAEIGNRHSVSGMSAERSIRYVADRVFRNAEKDHHIADKLVIIYGNVMCKGSLTNKEFLAGLYGYLVWMPLQEESA